MKVGISNPVLTDETTERTYLSADYSSGTTLTVANNQGFTDDWYVIVGEPGQEKTEAAQISSTSGNTSIVVSSALKFAHAKSTPVYLSQWNQWSFERQVSGGSFAEISTSPFNIEWDNPEKETIVNVTGGVTTDTYRWRPYNSASAGYGTYSDSLVGTGLARDSTGYLIREVKKVTVAREIYDETILNFFNDWQEVVYIQVPTAWWFVKEGSQVATVTSDYTYSISDNWSDFLSMKYLLYRYISGSTDIKYPLTWSPPAEFYNLKSDSNQSDDDYVKYWSLLPPDSSSAKGYIGLHPTPKTADCYLQPVYQFELSNLDSFGDTIVIPYPKGYTDYALYRIWEDIKQDKGNADKYNTRVAFNILSLKRKARRQLGQQEFNRFRGHRGWSRLFGEQSRLSSSEARENYW